MAFSPDEFARVREIFLGRKSWYTVQEAARLLMMAEECFERSRLEPEHGPDVSWCDVAHEAMEKYGVRQIEEALGEDAAAALPPLLRTTDVVLRLPQAYVFRFAAMARRKGWKLDDLVAWYMAGELGSLATYVSMEAEYPGIVEALTFPTCPVCDNAAENT